MSGGNGDAQPQVGDSVKDPEKGKRVVKHTAKALELLVENCQKTRGSCVKKASKLRETLKELMKENENTNAVKRHLEELIGLCGEARECHSSLVILPLAEEEIERQNKWFLPKIDILECFIQDVHVWLSEVKQQATHVTEPQIHVTEMEPPIHVTVETESQMEPQIHVTVETETQMELHVTDEGEKLSYQ